MFISVNYLYDFKAFTGRLLPIYMMFICQINLSYENKFSCQNSSRENREREGEGAESKLSALIKQGV